MARAYPTLCIILQDFETKLKETVSGKHLSVSSMKEIQDLALKNMHVRRGALAAVDPNLTTLPFPV